MATPAPATSTSSASQPSASQLASPSTPPLMHALTLVDRWYACTADGRKRFEGRLHMVSVPAVQAGDLLSITHAEEGALKPTLLRRVIRVHTFPSFREGLLALPLEHALPDVESVEEGEEIYRHFYTDDMQRQHGVCFIESEECSAAQADALSRAQDAEAFDAVVRARMQLREQLKQAWEGIQPAAGNAEQSLVQRHRVETHIQQQLDHALDGVASCPWPSALAPAAPASYPRTLSLWLQPRAGSAVAMQLASSVAALSSAHEQAAFAPHITLGGFEWPEEEALPIAELRETIAAAVKSLLGNDHSLRVTVEHVSTHPTLPFVTLVLLMERSEALLALRTAVHEHVVHPMQRRTGAALTPAFPFMPHLSLFYDTRRALSASAREMMVQHQVSWEGVRGHEAFRGLQFECGEISVVEIKGEDYTQWGRCCSVAPPAGLTPLEHPPKQLLPADSHPPSPSTRADEFRQLVDSLDHSLYLRLCVEQADASRRVCGAPVAAALVCDGQVVLSTADLRNGAPADEHVETALLKRAQELHQAGSAFFAPARMERMLLYTLHEPCAACLEFIVHAGVRTVLFGFRAPASTTAAAASPSALSVRGPLLSGELSSEPLLRL